MAKQYAMSGKDLAQKLRDFGFSKAKSHMSAFDPFDLVTAQGVLEANGIFPVSEGGGGPDAASGGLKVVKKLKRARPGEDADGATADEAAVAEDEAGARAGEPAAAPAAREAPAEGAPRTVPAAGETGAPAPPAHPTEAGERIAPREAAAEADGAGTAAAAAAADSRRDAAPSDPTREGRLEREPEEAARPGTAAIREPEVERPAGGAGRDESDGRAGARPERTAPVELSPAPRPQGAPARPHAAGAPPAREAAEDVQAPGATPARVEPAAARAGHAGPTLPAPVPRASASAPSRVEPSRRGNVIGFVDPSTFQQAQPKKRTTSRRLQSRDDSAPEVRPTLGRGGKGPQPSAAPQGQRGGLTAAQLREREQGRFLRRNRTSMTGQVQGRRAGGGRRTDSVTDSPFAGGVVAIDEPITIAKLADAMSLKAALLVKKGMESDLGMFAMNQVIDAETATVLALEFDVELQVREDISAEQAHLEAARKKRSEVEEGDLVERPPTVAFLGHVDHGKTTLIDKIRETRVAAGESGGITQHVGAYQVWTSKGHPVTIIDTPGHEAFTSMRARGARAVDIVVLVVAGDDGVKPSTVEAISHARAAKTPIVVAINKKDKPDFNPNAAIQQLMGHDLVPEQYGGNTAMFHTSGLTGEGIDELLEHIFLMSELELGLKAHPTGPAKGVVLEAEIQQGRGIVAHLLVQDGTLSKGDIILAGSGYGKVRQILSDRGDTIPEAGPSMPVAVTGLDALPGVGDTFLVIETLKEAQDIASERARTSRAKLLAESRDPRKHLEAMLGRDASVEYKTLNLIVRSDVQGTGEVIKSEIAKLEHEEVELKVILSGVGPVTESDVNLATTTEALIIAFKVGVDSRARQNADRAGVEVRRYDVIYELLDDLRQLMEGALAPEFEETITGHAEIRALFKSSRIGLIAGCMVLDGSIKRNSLARLLRDGSVVYTGSISSLRREKDDAKEVREGFECGIVLKDYRDIQQGDVIEAYEMKEIKRTL